MNEFYKLDGYIIYTDDDGYVMNVYEIDRDNMELIECEVVYYTTRAFDGYERRTYWSEKPITLNALRVAYNRGKIRFVEWGCEL